MSGDLIELAQWRASQTAGLETPRGHLQPSGQRSENQHITSSYLRAVKVVSAASTRSKKRQSPAARRPKVVKLMPRAAAYADAHAIKLDRSSASMAEDHKSENSDRQGEVGIFQLDTTKGKSDKSAMTTPDQARARIQKALDEAEVGPITVSLELGWERNYLRDFLEGKKDSLKAERYFQLSQQFNIPINELITIKEKPARRRA